jgi:hypothetical protein
VNESLERPLLVDKKDQIKQFHWPFSKRILALDVKWWTDWWEVQMTQRGTVRVLSLVLAKWAPTILLFLVGWSSSRRAFIMSDRLQRKLLPHTYRSVNFDIQKSVSPAKRKKSYRCNTHLRLFNSPSTWVNI